MEETAATSEAGAAEVGEKAVTAEAGAAEGEHPASAKIWGS